MAKEAQIMENVFKFLDINITVLCWLMFRIILILVRKHVIFILVQIHHNWRFRYVEGYAGVGKSCLLLQYTDKRYRDKH